MQLNGDFSNEFEAAFDLSRREARYPRQGRQVDALVAQGKHVVTFSAVQYCVFTDAALGSSLEIVSVHDTAEEAAAALEVLQPADAESYGDDSYYAVRPSAAALVAIAAAADDDYDYDSDEIPF